jgi:hypothetical protein
MIPRKYLLRLACSFLLAGLLLSTVLWLSLTARACGARAQTFSPVAGLTPQRQRACGLRNGFDRDFTDAERVSYLDFSARSMWRTQQACGRVAEIDATDVWPPPSIVYEMYGQPELVITDVSGRSIFACWCVRREWLATLSVDHPMRRALIGNQLPVRR